MYIAPNSELRILNQIPLDNTYDDTLYFASKSAQETYFLGQTKYVLNGAVGSNGSLLSYVRVNEGIIKVEIQIQNLQTCNYLMFRNISFGGKWFYAFITKVEYVNNVTTAIYFEIDVIQTWFYDSGTHLRECFVEREHSETDEIGDNLLTEPINPDTYYEKYLVDSNGNNGCYEWYEYACILFMIDDPNNGIQTQSLYDTYSGSYGQSGLVYRAPVVTIITNTDNDGNDYLVHELNDLGGDYDRVIGIIMYPKELLDVSWNNDGSGSFSSFTGGKSIHRHSFPITNNYSLEGYTNIKNKKLFTYPYNFIKVENSNKDITIKWEEFADSANATFEIFGYVTPTAQAIIYPTSYLGSGTYTDGNNVVQKRGNPLHALTIDSFPQIPMPVDAYKAWLAQKSSGDLMGIVGKTMGGIAMGAQATGSIQGAAIGGVIGLIGGTASYMQNQMYAQDASDSVKGNASTVIDQLHGTLGFRIKQMCVRTENARVIDDFFSMYGYACGKVKVPGTNVRPHWTYTKTIGCKLVGEFSNDDIVKIEKLFDKGIRFWNNPSEVGNYTLDNSPVVTP